MEDEEVAFIRHRSGSHCDGAIFHEISKEIFFSHLSLFKSTTTGFRLRDSAIKGKQDVKILLKSCFRGVGGGGGGGGKGNKMYYI
jgi:hypothetical protein